MARAKQPKTPKQLQAKPKRPKQTFLPGMEPPRIPALDAAADVYFETMQERVRLSKEEDQTKTSLIERMKEHGQERYETPDGLVVTLLSKSNVKCKRKQQEPSANGDAADEW